VTLGRTLAVSRLVRMQWLRAKPIALVPADFPLAYLYLRIIVALASRPATDGVWQSKLLAGSVRCSTTF